MNNDHHIHLLDIFNTGTHMTSRKRYFVDTSVLLYDKDAIHAFVGNTVCLSVQVLDEIDKFKSKQGVLGENARYVNRYLDSLRGEGKSLSEGVHDERYDIEYLVVLPRARENSDIDLDESVPDNRIILDAYRMMRVLPDEVVVVVTKDINMRVKCDSLGMRAEDYYRDHLSVKQVQNNNCVWSGQKELEVTSESINHLYDEGLVDLEEREHPNMLLVLKSGNQSALAIVDATGTRAKRLLNDSGKKSKSGIAPYDKEQSYALDILQNRDIPLVTLTGAPGSGKTFLTLLIGIEAVTAGEYERIVITRSMQTVGKEIGFLPGDIDEKMSPWLGPIMDNFRHAYKDTSYFKLMMDKGNVDVAPLSFIRGRSFPNSYIIVDEAQNATIHELKTIITRAGENSKIILMGDIEQIDTPYIDRYSNGLSVVIDKFKDSPLSGHIHLNRGRRSELANEANKLL